MSGLRVRGIEVGSSSPFLILPAATVGGPEVGDRGGHHDDVGGLRGVEHGVAHLAGGLHADGASTAAGGSRSAIVPATSVTSAPRWAATRASAYP